MQYGDLVKVYEAIESTASRLEMADILANLFRSSDCKNIRTIVYMTQGNIVPDFYPEKLGMADKLYLRALSMATGQKGSRIKELWDKEGDTGKSSYGSSENL